MAVSQREELDQDTSLLDIILILTLIEPLILMLQIGVEYSINSGTLRTKYTFCSSKIIGNRWSRTSPLL